MVITDLQNDFDYIQALVIQADGKIVAAGTSAYPDNPGGAAFALSWYNSNGSPDATFGDQGKVLTEIGPGWDDIWSMVIQAYGNLITAGYGFGEVAGAYSNQGIPTTHHFFN